MELIQNRHDAIKKKNKIFFILIIFFTTIAFVLRFLLTVFEINPKTNLYEGAGPLIIFFDYAIAGVILFIWLSSKFMYREKIRFVDIDGDKMTQSKKGIVYHESASVMVQGTQTLVISSSLTGFLLVASFVLQILDIINDPVWKNNLSGYIKNNTFDFILIFAAILGAVYFFKTASLRPIGTTLGDNDAAIPKFSQGYILFSFFPIIWVFLNIFKCFFDMNKSVNSPIRIYELVCFLSLSLYLVAESRILVGKRETSKFFSFAYTSILLTSLSALPNFILSSFWILETSTPVIVYGVQISLLLYISSRIYSQIKYGEYLLIKAPSNEKSPSKDLESVEQDKEDEQDKEREEN